MVWDGKTVKNAGHILAIIINFFKRMVVCLRIMAYPKNFAFYMVICFSFIGKYREVPL